MRETLKVQLAIFFVLLLIFCCQKFIKILSATVDGEIPTNLVLSLLGLGIPEMAQLILPLSLFLSLLMSFGKFSTESEIIIMHACGLSRTELVKAAMVLALFTGLIATINVTWASPISILYQDKVLLQAKTNPGMTQWAKGQFKQTTDGNLVIFIKTIDRNRFIEIFLAQFHNKSNSYPSIVVADSGELIQCKDGSKILILDKGTRFESTAMLHDFRITDFQNYQVIISHHPVAINKNDTARMNIHTLIKTNTKQAKAEINWRITLIFSVFIMALMVVPLSMVDPRNGRSLSILPSIILYLTFFLLQTSIKSNIGKGSMNTITWSWTVNGIYLLLAIGLNSWDTALIRRLRSTLKLKGIM